MKQPDGVHTGESKARCTLEMRPAAEAQKFTFLSSLRHLKAAELYVKFTHNRAKIKRIKNVQKKLMSWLKVASPSSQQAEHQNHTADPFHTPSFM